MSELKILMITHNRPRYTRLALERLCETIPGNAKIIVWDNGSENETLETVKSFEGRKQVERVVYSNTNERLWGPTNWFWKNYGKADFLSKVDDDCLLPPNWCEALTRAHRDIPRAGVLGCWRFLPEDFLPSSAKHKITDFSGHLIMRNCWVEGSGYIMKGRVMKDIGPLRHGESFTTWCLRAAKKGYVNGWYYPFLYQEHMDDPRSVNTCLKTDADFRKFAPLSAKENGINSKSAWIERLKQSSKKLQEYSIDPDDFIGLKARVKRKLCKLAGREYLPKMRQ